MPPKQSSLAAGQAASKSKGKFSLGGSKSQHQPNRKSNNNAAGKRKRVDNKGRAQGAASDASDDDDDDAYLNEEQENDGQSDDDNDTEEEIENAKEGKSKKTQSECVNRVYQALVAAG